MLGYVKSQWVETEVTSDYETEEVRTVYAVKPTSFKGRAKLASGDKLRSDCTFFIFFDESEEVKTVRVTWDVDVISASRSTMSRSLENGLHDLSLWGSREALRRDGVVVEEDGKNFTRLYAGGIMPSLGLTLTHDAGGNPQLRARRDNAEETSPMLLLNVGFDRNNVFGMPELITVERETKVSVPFDPVSYVEAPLCLFLREGTERLLLTGEGVCLDPIMVMSQKGAIRKTWKNKCNFLGAGTRLTFWVDFLPGTDRPRGLVNVRAKFSGILEITAVA